MSKQRVIILVVATLITIFLYLSMTTHEVTGEEETSTDTSGHPYLVQKNIVPKKQQTPKTPVKAVVIPDSTPSTLKPRILTYDTVLALVSQYKWHVPTVMRIMNCESGADGGFDAHAHNDNWRTKDNSYGLMQINMLDKPGYPMGANRRARFNITNEDLFNPEVNIWVAWELSNHGTNFTPWSCY